ncbi:MAG TPA: hypothetical protein PLT23_01920 [Lentisphaeria bacterium]|nr:MAG: hypothetical protein BWX73_02985 [Lentisphaerae bacterium ADurb.Bin082]HPY89454.1 hypothetical protein [Lentisphaeria bacterium]HQL86341.1 hypothetical protein [Lentisphaeria bacterium]
MKTFCWKMFLVLFGGVVLGGVAQAQGTVSTTTAKAVVKVTTAAQPFVKIAVLDFQTTEKIGMDILGKIPAAGGDMQALSDADRLSIDGVMQGFVKMLESSANVGAYSDKWEEQLSLFKTALQGKPRPAILGAEYLTAYLGRHGDVFACKDSTLVKAAMLKLQKEPDFPKDFMKKLAAETGATHLLYCTVSDIRSKENAFTGYGISTRTTLCQLDVIVKMVALEAQHVVFSNVYTGNYKEQRPISVEQFDNNVYQNLMTSALEQAAEGLYEFCKSNIAVQETR